MTDEELFIPFANHHRRRVQCTVCGKAGYEGGKWQDKCRAGHPHVCSCGRAFNARAGLAAHRRHYPKDVHVPADIVGQPTEPPTK